jgi:hypothetical protein
LLRKRKRRELSHKERKEGRNKDFVERVTWSM